MYWPGPAALATDTGPPGTMLRRRASPRSSRRGSRGSADTDHRRLRGGAHAWQRSADGRAALVRRAGRAVRSRAAHLRPDPAGRGGPVRQVQPADRPGGDRGRRDHRRRPSLGPGRAGPGRAGSGAGSDLTGAGWKIGAASQEIRRAEGLPSPSPGIIYAHTIFPSGALLPGSLFINYRNCECEFAFQLGLDFPARAEPYTEADARAGIDSLFPALEI